MTTIVDGTTGVSLVQDGVVVTADIADANVTPAKLSGGQSGAAPIYGARAWCTFNSATAGTNPPTSGGNIASVNHIGAGTFSVTFTTAMPDANYMVLFRPAGGTTSAGGFSYAISAQTTTSFILSHYLGGAASDAGLGMTGVVVFR